MTILQHVKNPGCFQNCTINFVNMFVPVCVSFGCLLMLKLTRDISIVYSSEFISLMHNLMYVCGYMDNICLYKERHKQQHVYAQPLSYFVYPPILHAMNIKQLGYSNVRNVLFYLMPIHAYQRHLWQSNFVIILEQVD